jgi:hypothetical protein
LGHALIDFSKTKYRPIPLFEIYSTHVLFVIDERHGKLMEATAQGTGEETKPADKALISMKSRD